MSNKIMNVNVISQPKGLKIPLYPHQLANIYKMEEVENNNIVSTGDDSYSISNIGFISDPHGYGKTLSILGLISRDKMKWELNTPFTFQKVNVEAKYRLKHHTIYRYTKLPFTLIVTDQTNLLSWKKDLSQTDIKYIVLETKRDCDNLAIGDTTCIIVLPSVYNYLVSNYSEYAWKRFIYDDPEILKIPCMKEIQANFYWFISTNPKSISQLHRNCKDNFVKDLFFFTHNFKTEFKGFFIQNETKFLDYSVKLPKINDFIHQYFSPQYLPTNNFHHSIIKNYIAINDIENAILTLGGAKTTKIKDLIQIFRNDVTYEVPDKYINPEKHLCNICLCEVEDPVLEPNCQTIFCGKCILQWCQGNQRTCPICRKKIQGSDLIYIKKNEMDIEEDDDDNDILIRKPLENFQTKNEVILDIILKKKENGKFIIYQNYYYDYYLDLTKLFNDLRENDISYTVLKGNLTKRKEKTLELFESNTYQVLVIQNNHQGFAFNNCSDIIFSNSTNSQSEEQIIGKIMKIGRKDELNVHRINMFS